jgi:carbonic anhydrase
LKTLNKEMQDKISPSMAVQLLKDGNQRFINNLKINRNLFQQMNDTSDGQHPFAVIISCMDSRTSAELIFDQGLGDIFSIRIAGNVINEDILGSAEFGCKVIGAKVVVVLGHSSCGAIKGAVQNVDLGHLHFITHKIQRCIPLLKKQLPSASLDELCVQVTKGNIELGVQDLKSRSSILEDMSYKGEIIIIGANYDISTGTVEFFETEQ